MGRRIPEDAEARNHFDLAFQQTSSDSARMATGLLKHFRFSWKVTTTCVLLAAVMVRASFWQWDRYVRKVALVESYEEQSKVEPIPLTAERIKAGDFADLENKKISVSGEFDFENQIISTNKKHWSGPGHWLLTPFKIDGSEKSIIVSRGFIPFADREPETWRKYDSAAREDLVGVLKKSVEPVMLGPENPAPKVGEKLSRIWYFEQIDQIAPQLPYPVIETVYIQRLGKPVVGDFPAQAVSIEIPPSTHFGYTIEWALLAMTTLIVGFVLQAMPRFHRKRQLRYESE